MKKFKISNNAIRRLPRYLRYLDGLAAHNVVRISSGEMGKQMGLTASQIRQDFSCFGEFGQQGYGYNVSVLRQEISEILGLNKKRTAIIIGVGNLGHALLENFPFDSCGISLIAAFDVSKKIAGNVLSGVPVYHSNTLKSYLETNDVDIAIFTLPKSEANSTAELVTSNGVKGIWNFTNEEIENAAEGTIIENVHFSDSLMTLSYYLNDRSDSGEQ